MNVPEWLKGLQIGDRVVIDYNNCVDGKVVRITPTLIITGHKNHADTGYERRFMKRSGREHGSSGFFRSILYPYTAEYVAHKSHKGLVREVMRLMDDLPPSVLIKKSNEALATLRAALIAAGKKS